ncbi:CysK Cysteine synthase [Pyrenophora tritici-repentis]|nr:CysK Cysteine synthase [Pyrenophora tritici-repentis]
MRICRHNLDILLVFSQTTRKPCNSTAGTCTSHKTGNLALGLCPDLLGRAVLVRERVIRVGVLVQDMRIGDLLDQAPGNANVALGTIPRRTRRRSDNLCPKRLENRHLLRAHLLGQRDDCPVALDRADQRKPDTRVAGCGLDECVTGLYAARPLGFLDHAQRDTVFDTAAGIEGFDLCVHGGADTERLRDLVQADERRVADLLGNAVHDDGRDSGASFGRHYRGL